MCILYMALHIGFAGCLFIPLELSCSEFAQRCILRGFFIIDGRRINTTWQT